MAEKERCHVCGRNRKVGTECKVCHAGPDEVVRLGYSGIHIINPMATRAVNVYLTNKRFLVFENMGSTGSMVGGATGGLVGGLIGAAADKAIGKTVGKNGSIRQNYTFADIRGVNLEENKKRGFLLVVEDTKGKSYKYSLDYDFTEVGLDITGLYNELIKVVG